MVVLLHKETNIPIIMRNEIKEYEAVAQATEKFVRSVAEGNSAYAIKNKFYGY